MPSSPATRRASAASSTEQQPCLLFPAPGAPEPSPATSQDSGAASVASTPFGEPSRMNTPITSYPWRSSSAAATELSTPPLMATTTFLRGGAIAGPGDRMIRGLATGGTAGPAVLDF